MYLTFAEYITMGGALDEAAFNRNIVRACSQINAETHGRVKQMQQIPDEVKALCRDLCDFYSDSKIGYASHSQSAGALSESESFKTAEQTTADIENLIRDYLLDVTDDNGTPLLYRGAR